jgi:tripartite-type tricarboxylate transporter receptor subunit TctC
MELLKQRVGISIEHVPYKGSGPLKTDLLGGHIPLGVDGLGGLVDLIRSGKVKALAVLAPKRTPLAPEIPSLGDMGINDVDGNGTSSHVKLANLNQAAKVDITHVPYKGSAPATVDVAAGQIDGLIAAVPDVGRNPLLRLLAITTDARVARWPDVPSVRELGLAPLVASNWFGISGPAGIPGPVADRLNAALVAALNTPELAERLRDMGAEPNRMTRANYTAMIAADIARWAEVVRSANIHID